MLANQIHKEAEGDTKSELASVVRMAQPHTTNSLLSINQFLNESRPLKCTSSSSLEQLVPRLGHYLLQQGNISDDQLAAALAIQEKRRNKGESVLLGRILLEQNMIDAETLDNAVARQILEMHRVMQAQNRELESRVSERTAALNKAYSQLAELQQMKDDFVGAVSHELRTPLTYILGYLDLFTNGSFGELTTEQKTALEAMKTASDRLHNLVSDLITYATASQQGLQIHSKPIPIRVLLQKALREIKDKAEARNIQLMVEVPRPYPTVQADHEKISWVLSQLLDNAVKFNRPGGSVYLHVQQQAAESVAISVRDNGPGIPEERMQEVFKAFHQLDGSSTRYAGGIGLGLALAQQIMKSHDSNLHIASRPGLGTQVSFSLPLASVSH